MNARTLQRTSTAMVVIILLVAFMQAMPQQKVDATSLVQPFISLWDSWFTHTVATQDYTAALERAHATTDDKADTAIDTPYRSRETRDGNGFKSWYSLTSLFAHCSGWFRVIDPDSGKFFDVYLPQKNSPCTLKDLGIALLQLALKAIGGGMALTGVQSWLTFTGQILVSDLRLSTEVGKVLIELITP